MAVFKSVESYRKSIRTRTQNQVRRAKGNGARAAIYLTGLLKSTAPVDKGDLAKSVQRNGTKRGYSVIAGYIKGNFNVGKYINMELNNKLSAGRKYPTRNATSLVNPWFTENVKKMQKRYRQGYKFVRAAMRS